MKFVDNEHVIPVGIDVRESPVWRRLPQLACPGQADVLRSFAPLLVTDRNRVCPGQDLVPPLGHERVRNDDESAKTRSLVSQCIQDHQGLDGLAEAYLVGKQMSDPHVSKDSKRIRYLVACK